MTQIHWLSDVSGSFTNPADWAGGIVPRSGDDAILDPAGVSPFTAALTTNEEVNSIQTAANATLAITGKLFRAVNGTGAGVNAGTISVGGRSGVRADGVFDNAGTIALHRLMTTGPGTGALTLTGGGIVTEYTPNGIAAHGRITGGDLTNVDNTIEGGSATSKRGLYIQLAGTLTNGAGGVISSDSADTFQGGGHIRSGVIDNYGLIENTGVLLVKAATVMNSGTMWSHSPQTSLGNYGLFVDAGQFDNSGLVRSGPRQSVGIRSQTFVNTGTIDNEGGFVTIIPATESSTVTNAGLILNAVYGGGIALGAAFATGRFDNTGTILATAGSIEIYPAHASAHAISNTGTIEASGDSQIFVESGLDNGGVVEVSGGTIFLGELDGQAATISAGTLSLTSGDANVQFIGSSGVLYVTQPQIFTGSVYGFPSTGGAGLDFGDVNYTGGQQASFSGDASGGTLTVTDGTRTASLHLVGDYLSTTFVTSQGQGLSVLVTASSRGTPAFVAAMAGIGGGNGSRAEGSPHTSAAAGLLFTQHLFAPRPALA